LVFPPWNESAAILGGGRSGNLKRSCAARVFDTDLVLHSMTTQIYLGKIPETEAIRRIENLYA